MDKVRYLLSQRQDQERQNDFHSMLKPVKLFAFILRSVITGLAIAFVVILLWPSMVERLNDSEPPVVAPPPVAPFSYAEAVDRAAPAVVSIYTRSLMPQSMDPALQNETGFRYLYRMRQDMGSGVLLSEDGYILTNHHVINNVQNIRIALWDGRIAPAQVVGSDPSTDLAVLKINLTGLPVAPLSEQVEIRVGDVVLAIGNALGLSHTVTMGIVSATGRNDLRSVLYEDFIQTDAAINAGNSGGALINARGELIGISTRKLRVSTGAQNIGFAIPITLARNVMQQIIEYGSVRRGWLGASFSNLQPRAQPDGSAARRGINVRDVSRGGPAWNAGIRQGDIILSLGEQAVDDASQFLLQISQLEPGSRVELEIYRRPETFLTYATLIQQPPLK
jgi:serine peptidase DegS